jgi:hypothetical protein
MVSPGFCSMRSSASRSAGPSVVTNKRSVRLRIPVASQRANVRGELVVRATLRATPTRVRKPGFLSGPPRTLGRVDVCSWTDWLAVIGGLLQCLGLGLTVMEIVRTENRVFPERTHRARRALARLSAWWPPWQKPVPVHSRTVLLSGTAGGRAGASGEVTVTSVPADPLARIEALEQRVTTLHAEQQAALGVLRDRMTESDQLLGQRIANLANDVYAARDEDRGALDESLARQKIYTGTFIVGTILATVASVYA